MSLKKYRDVIYLAGLPVPNKYAYHMDGKHCSYDMRIDAGLGSCSCVDYFKPQGDSILIIEESQMKTKITGYKNEYGYLKSADQINVARKRLLNEIHLKVYGTLLVLCYLSEICKSAKSLLQNKNYEFWIVISEKIPISEKRFFENLKNNLIGALGNLKVVTDVKVVFIEDFRNKFP